MSLWLLEHNHQWLLHKNAYNHTNLYLPGQIRLSLSPNQNKNQCDFFSHKWKSIVYLCAEWRLDGCPIPVPYIYSPHHKQRCHLCNRFASIQIEKARANSSHRNVEPRRRSKELAYTNIQWVIHLSNIINRHIKQFLVDFFSINFEFVFSVLNIVSSTSHHKTSAVAHRKHNANN